MLERLLINFLMPKNGFFLELFLSKVKLLVGLAKSLILYCSQTLSHKLVTHRLGRSPCHFSYKILFYKIMIAFYKHLISASTEMLVISKATASGDRKKNKPQQTKQIQKILLSQNQRQPLLIHKIIKYFQKLT